MKQAGAEHVARQHDRALQSRAAKFHIGLTKLERFDGSCGIPHFTAIGRPGRMRKLTLRYPEVSGAGGDAG